MAKERRGFEKIYGDRCPTSSGNRSVFTGGPAQTRSLNKSIYGSTPKETVTRDANAMGGNRSSDLIGKRGTTIISGG